MPAAWVGAAAGVIGALNSGGSGGSQTTTQKSDPWSGIQPYLSNLYGNADQYFKTGGPQYYPGNTIAPTSGNTINALQRGTDLATGGQPNINAAQGANLNTINGAGLNANPANPYLQQLMGGSAFTNNPSNNYFQQAAGGSFLNSNPYLDQMYKSATDPMVNQYKNAIAPGLMSQFSAAGRTGSNSNMQALQMAQQPLAQGLAQAASSIYGGNYANERALQQSAAQGLGANYMGGQNMGLQAAGNLGQNYNFASGQQQNAINNSIPLGQQSWQNIQNLMGIGQTQEQYGQKNLNADIARFDYGQNQPLMNLQNYAALLQGMSPYASKTGTISGPSANPFTTAIGGGLAGAKLGSAFQGSDMWNTLGGLFGNNMSLDTGGAGLGGTGGNYGQGGDYGLNSYDNSWYVG